MPSEAPEILKTVGDAEGVTLGTLSSNTMLGHSMVSVQQENKLVDPGCSTGGITANSQAIHKSPGESGSINSAADSYTAAIPRAAACGASESSGEVDTTIKTLPHKLQLFSVTVLLPYFVSCRLEPAFRF